MAGSNPKISSIELWGKGVMGEPNKGLNKILEGIFLKYFFVRLGFPMVLPTVTLRDYIRVVPT